MLNLQLLELANATWETIYIVFISSALSLILGFGLGLLLFLTDSKDFFANKYLNRTLAFVTNTIRSVPFIILMISILPLTRLLTGTTIGANAAIVPLTLAAIPLFARICENTFKELPKELLETAYSLGANHWQFITKFLIPESLSSLIRGATLTIIGLLGYSAMAGVVGGGGLGELAINYGYQRFNAIVTIETVIVLVAIVQLVQLIGDKLASKPNFKFILTGTCVLLIACFSSQLYPLFNRPEASIKVGILAGWSEDVMKVAKKVAEEKYHLQIKTVVFTDYVLPNSALAAGDIDANIFQHVPYLDEQNKAQHFNLIALAKTFVYPMGFYSQKISSLSDLNHNALVAIPNDPSNEARALLLLQKAGVISLRPNVTTLASIKDITSNPKNLRFKLLDAAQLPRVLKDADLVAITNDYLSAVGLTLQQSLLKEGSDSLYANIIAIRKSDADNEHLQELAKVMHSKAVLEETEKIFPNQAAIPAWQ